MLLTIRRDCGLMFPARKFSVSKLPVLISGLIFLNTRRKGEGDLDIGEKLRTLRLKRNLTQEEMADRCELSKGFISQVERNLASPSIATLTDMLEALGSSLTEFFSERGDEKNVFSQSDMFVKEDEELLKGSITWLVPSAQKNAMEPILVALGEGGRTQDMPPHEGEEFGYVLQGTVTLLTGGKRHRVRTGESFCLHPTDTHCIANEGKREARFVWVSTPPNF